MKDGDQVRLILQALPGPSPAINRLRQALKALLRSFGFRCVAIEALPKSDAPETTTDPTQRTSSCSE